MITNRRLILVTNGVEFKLTDRSTLNKSLAACLQISLRLLSRRQTLFVEFKLCAGHLKRFVASDEVGVARAVLHDLLLSGCRQAFELLHGASQLATLDLL